MKTTGFLLGLSMARILLLLITLYSCADVFAGDPRKPIFDVTHYHIALDISNTPSKTISGSCTISIKSLQNNLQEINLDLYKLGTDSVKQNGNFLSYSLISNTGIKITLGQVLNVGDSTKVIVYYRGTPSTVPSFGGFYFSGVYAFNMGVNINASPASFGQAWFPCSDHFEDKSTFSFSILTDTSNRALCNGVLESAILLGSKIEWNWKMDQSICTYLAAVAVAPYGVVNDVYIGLNGDSNKITLAALPADTLKMKASFSNLKNVTRIFEECYGNHMYPRIGFNVVPFNGGAMEHATNITYPLFGITGDHAFESLYAHELSHHWWGDNVTCSDPSQMWLNEGWASFSEILFTEKLYGREQGNLNFMEKMYKVIRAAHHLDGGIYAVNNIPTALTYGTHVYSKGAVVAHTLRAYLGDAVFFSAIRNAMIAFKDKNWNTVDFQNYLETFTGKDLDNYFTDWVNSPGFVSVTARIEEMKRNGADYEYKIRVSQRKRWAANYYNAIPVDITFKGTQGEFIKSVILNGADTTFTYTTNQELFLVAADRNENLADAVTGDEFKLKSTANIAGKYSISNVNVKEDLGDTTLLRISHVWTSPELTNNFIDGASRVANRYWIISGNFKEETEDIAVSLQYDGRKGTDFQNAGWLDTSLIKTTEDSLNVFFRAPGTTYWIRLEDVKDERGSFVDRKGSIGLTKLRKGEYILAIYKYGLTTPKIKNEKLMIYPNPSGEFVTISGPENTAEFNYRIFDAKGSMVLEGAVHSGSIISTKPLVPGNYTIELQENGNVVTQKLVISR